MDTCELQLPPPWTLPLAALSGGDESLQTDIDNDGSYYLGGGRRQARRMRNFFAPACRPRATAMRAAATGARRPLPCLHFLLLCLCLLQQAYTGWSSSQRAGWARSLLAAVLPIASGWLTIKTLTGRVGLVHKPSECVDKVSSEWSDDDGKGEVELVEMNQVQLLTSH